MTMYEITYCYLEDGSWDKGIFFSEAEWEAFQEDSAEAGCPVAVKKCQVLTPNEFWEHAQQVGYDEAYAIEIMAIATFGYEETAKYDKVEDLSRLLKSKGIICY